MREGAKDSVVGEGHEVLGVGVVSAVERKLKIDSFASVEAIWRNTHHGLLVSVDSRDELWCDLSLVSNQAKLALDEFGIRNVTKSLALNEDFCSALLRAISGRHTQEHWLHVVAEEEARVDPVDTIQRHVDWLLLHNVIVRWRLADNSDRGDELSANNFLSNLTEGQHSEF